jgi:hypothetical protein
MMRRMSKEKDVIERIEKKIKSPNLKEDMIDNVDDLSLRETGMLYDDVDFGEKSKLTKKRDIKINWTDHAEYRGELRDIKPEKMNDMVKERMKSKLLKNQGDRSKIKLKKPGVGTAVVDYDLKRTPAEADIVTTWASTQINKVANVLKKAKAK